MADLITIKVLNREQILENAHLAPGDVLTLSPWYTGTVETKEELAKLVKDGDKDAKAGHVLVLGDNMIEVNPDEDPARLQMDAVIGNVVRRSSPGALPSGVRPDSPAPAPSPAVTADFSAMTKDQLGAWLGARQISYPQAATKQDLIGLAEGAQQSAGPQAPVA